MIKKEYILLAVLSAGFSFPVQGQTTWTKQDSIKLKEILDGTTDISINPTVKQEIDLLFSTPAQIHSIPILPVEELTQAGKSPADIRDNTSSAGQYTHILQHPTTE